MKRFLLLLPFLVFLACQNKKENSQTFFSKPPEEKLDSVCIWLSQDSNYLKKEYLPFFEKNFNQQIAVNRLDSAARLLGIAGIISYDNDIFDTVIVQKHLDFLAKYENQIKPRFRTLLFFNLGSIFMNSQEFEKCITYLRKNNFTPEDYYSENYIGWSHYYLMYSFSATAQYDSSIVYGQKAIAIFEGNQNKTGQLGVYTSTAGTYRHMENYEEAKKCTDKSLAIAIEIHDSTHIFTGMYDIFLYNEATKSPLLSSSIDDIVDFEKKWQSNDPRFKLAAQSILAMKYLIDSNYVETDNILKRIAPLFPLVKEEYYNFYYLTTLAEYENARRKPLSLRKLYLKELQDATTNKYYTDVITYSEILSEEANHLKDYKSAFYYLQEMVNAKESYTKTKVRQEASELEKKYQTEKKEAQIKLQAADASKKNVFIAFLIFGLLAFVYFYNFLKKKNTVITQQNELNEHTIAILSHDIKEPLLGVKLLLKKLNKDDPFVAQASHSLENQINAVNGILNNLLKMKKLSLVKKDKNTTANVNTVVKNVTQELSVAIQSKALTINNELTDELTVPIAQEKLQIVVHNLLSNAVKYSFPNQSIRIFKEGNGFCIQDFGVGLSPEQRSKIMREVTASQQGTSQERGNGMGLFLVGAMLQGESIRLVFENSEVGGTIVKVLG